MNEKVNSIFVAAALCLAVVGLAPLAAAEPAPSVVCTASFPPECEVRHPPDVLVATCEMSAPPECKTS